MNKFILNLIFAINVCNFLHSMEQDTKEAVQQSPDDTDNILSCIKAFLDKKFTVVDDQYIAYPSYTHPAVFHTVSLKDFCDLYHKICAEAQFSAGIIYIHPTPKSRALEDFHYFIKNLDLPKNPPTTTSSGFEKKLGKKFNELAAARNISVELFWQEKREQIIKNRELLLEAIESGSNKQIEESCKQLLHPTEFLLPKPD